MCCQRSISFNGKTILNGRPIESKVAPVSRVPQQKIPEMNTMWMWAPRHASVPFISSFTPEPCLSPPLFPFHNCLPRCSLEKFAFCPKSSPFLSRLHWPFCTRSAGEIVLSHFDIFFLLKLTNEHGYEQRRPIAFQVCCSTNIIQTRANK